MGRSVDVLRENLPQHPAALAWNAIAPERVEPNSIAVFKHWKKQMKSGVYRLGGVGPGGAAVIAKRCPFHTAAIEQFIYEEFLPHLPLPSVGYYGSVEDRDGQSRWVFLEEARGELYSPLNPEHRALAGRWLAAMHDTGRRHDWRRLLPDRSLERSRGLLRSCRIKVLDQLTNPSLPSDGPAVLQRVAEQCDVLESRWIELDAICNAAPRTVIHGDFVVKNLRVRPSAKGPELLVYDWEFAGLGAPCADLAQFIGRMASPDLSVYRACLQDWPGAGGDSQIQQWAQCGRFIRLVDIMYWASLGLMAGPPNFLTKPVKELAVYSLRMSRALKEAGWTTHD
jgi:hypothetical protein